MVRREGSGELHREEERLRDWRYEFDIFIGWISRPYSVPNSVSDSLSCSVLEPFFLR
jgi:hypothetical protein